MSLDAPKKDITVVGAGMVGMACALHALRDGHKVTLIDRDAPGQATSFGNAGVMAPCAVVPVPVPGIIWKAPKMLFDPLGPLFLRWRYLPQLLHWLPAYLAAGRRERVEAISESLSALLHDVMEQHQALARGSEAAELLQPSDYLYIYDSEVAFQKDSFGWDLRRRRGVKFETLHSDALHDLEPTLGPAAGFGVLLPNHGFIRNPGRLVTLLAEAFEREGGVILQRDVEDIEIGPEGPRALLTAEGPLPVDHLVIAAGAWSGKLAARLGTKVPLETERGYHVVLTDPGVMPRHPMMDASGKFVTTPMEMGLRLAGLVEFGGLEAAPNYARAKILLNHAKRLFPGIRTDSYEEWMGHRPSLPDSLPVIGPSPKFGKVYFAFGHQHVGMMSGPKTGRLIADLIAGRKPNIDLAAFDVGRF
jgi:D-amino-acid dehydrogenase